MARATLQQNSLTEVSFVTIGNRGRGMMIAADMPYATRYRVFQEAFAWATMLDWLVFTNIDDKHGEHGKRPVWSKSKQFHTKLANKGITCIFVDYALNHKDGVYRMWHPSTNNVRISRDVAWFKCMFCTKPQEDQQITVGIPKEVRESDDEEEATVTPIEDSPPTPEEGAELEHTTPAFKEAKDANYGEGFQKYIAKAEFGCQASLHEMIAGIGAGLGGGFKNTHELKIMKYNKAMVVDGEG
eukprot:7188162-Ditylum_brightwellii.AAC.1